jgi:hypothetical protein
MIYAWFTAPINKLIVNRLIGMRGYTSIMSEQFIDDVSPPYDSFMWAVTNHSSGSQFIELWTSHYYDEIELPLGSSISINTPLIPIAVVPRNCRLEYPNFAESIGEQMACVHYGIDMNMHYSADAIRRKARDERNTITIGQCRKNLTDPHTYYGLLAIVVNSEIRNDTNSVVHIYEKQHNEDSHSQEDLCFFSKNQTWQVQCAHLPRFTRFNGTAQHISIRATRWSTDGPDIDGNTISVYFGDFRCPKCPLYNRFEHRCFAPIEDLFDMRQNNPLPRLNRVSWTCKNIRLCNKYSNCPSDDNPYIPI